MIGPELYSTLTGALGDRRQTEEGRLKLDLAVQKADLVTQFPLFNSLDERSRRKLGRALVTRYVSAGEVILRKDTPARSVYFIASGAVEVETAGLTDRLGRGEMFGQLSILSRIRRRTSVVAITHGVLLALDEARFLRLMRRSPGLREAVRASAVKRGVSPDRLAGLDGA